MMKKISKIDPAIRIMIWGFLTTLLFYFIELQKNQIQLSLYSMFVLYLITTIHIYISKIFNRQQSRRKLESKLFKVVSYLEFLRKKENTAIQVIAVTDEILKLIGEEEK